MNDILNFREISRKWIEYKKSRVKTSSMAAYSQNLEKHLLPYFENFNDVQKKDIQNFIEIKLKEGLSPKRIKDLLVVLKMILKFGNLSVNFNCKDFVFPTSPERKEVSVFTLPQQKILINYLSNHISLKNVGILLCLTTGLRIGEICGLKWVDINRNDGSLKITRTLYRMKVAVRDESGPKTILVFNPPKTLSSCRTIPLPEIFFRMIEKLDIEINVKGYVLTNSMKPLEPRAMRYYFDSLLKKVGLPHLKFHGLRHTFATRCIESECDYKTVSMILGHADISTTMNMYVHPSFDHRRNCIEKMLKDIEQTNLS